MGKEVRLSNKHTRPQRGTPKQKKTNTGSFSSLCGSISHTHTHTRGESTVQYEEWKEGGPLFSPQHTSTTSTTSQFDDGLGCDSRGSEPPDVKEEEGVRPLPKNHYYYLSSSTARTFRPPSSSQCSMSIAQLVQSTVRKINQPPPTFISSSSLRVFWKK